MQIRRQRVAVWLNCLHFKAKPVKAFFNKFFFLSFQVMDTIKALGLILRTWLVSGMKIECLGVW